MRVLRDALIYGYNDKSLGSFKKLVSMHWYKKYQGIIKYEGLKWLGELRKEREGTTRGINNTEYH